jgi:hypothetical protein
MNLQEMTIEQLKALGFDLIKQLEITQVNLRTINEEIEKRANRTEEPAEV